MNAEQKAIKAIWSIVLIESKIVIYSESFWQPAATLCFQSLLKTVYHDNAEAVNGGCVLSEANVLISSSLFLTGCF